MAIIFANFENNPNGINEHTQMGFIAVYEVVKGYEAFRESNGRPGFERQVSVTQLVEFARKCNPITHTPQQIRNTIHASGKQFGLVQIGNAYFARINNCWIVLA